MNVVDKYNAGVFRSFLILRRAAEQVPFARWFVIDHEKKINSFIVLSLGPL